MINRWRTRRQVLANRVSSDSASKQFSKGFLNFLLFFVWGSLAAFLTGLDIDQVHRRERQSQSLFLELRGPIPPPDAVVIVAIDDQSLAAAQTYADDPSKRDILNLMNRYPWKREAYAIAIDYLISAGAKTVALDLLFDLPSSYGDADDQRFAQALKHHAHKTVLAMSYEQSLGPQGASLELIQPTAILRSVPIQQGLVNYLPPESDGLVHKLGRAYQAQILRPLQLKEFPSFAQATLTTAQLPHPEPRGEDIFFYGPVGMFPRIPFWQLLAPDWQAVFREQQTFQNKIVLIGTTAETAQFADLVRTPFSEKMPGVELHANAIATLLEGRAIATVFPDSWPRGLFVLVLVAGVGGVISRLAHRPVWQLVIGLSVAIGYLGIAYGVFTYGYWVVPIVAPVSAILLGSFSCFTAGVIQNELEKLRLRRTLERYVAAPVVEEILRQPESMLGGKRLKAAVLFADIRGFTNLSYKLPPETLVQQLNRYFEVMVEEVLKTGGTVDKFIGDAIMAEFGFPVSHGDQEEALRAVKAALGMRRALLELRSQFLQEGQVPFFNGIGISFGEVIAGNLGSFKRREYGVIGDTVNVASRVEGLTKRFRTDILITESLYQLVKDAVIVTPLGDCALRGREEETIQLYGLIGLKGEDTALYDQVMQELHQYLGTPPT